MSARESLRRLVSIGTGYPAGEEKTRLLTTLARAALPTSDEVLTFHETALFLRAWPDDEAVLNAAEAALRGQGGSRPG